MNRLIIVLLLAIQITAASGQLTLEACHEKAKNNYPLIHQYELIGQSENFNISNANKGYLPQISISAKATYQSEVIELPINIPGIKSLDKDQYQATVEISQTLWDGGIISTQKEITKASTEVEKKKYEVDIYTLKERINQIYFGILLINEQQSLNDLLQKELENSYNRVKALVENGLANQPDLDIIKVEQLKTQQKKAELIFALRAYKEMLSAFTGESISETTTFVKPEGGSDALKKSSSNRPELAFFEAQISMNESQKKSIYAANKPKIGLFIQGGFGKPGLNMLNNEFSPFCIGGIRLNWNLGYFYTQGNNLKKIELNKKYIDVQKEIFEFNTNLKVSQQNNEITKITEILKNDDEIINLRTSIKKAAEKKVENGTMTVTDLIREINAENFAIQEKSLHEIQLLNAIFNLKNTTNN